MYKLATIHICAVNNFPIIPMTTRILKGPVSGTTQGSFADPILARNNSVITPTWFYRYSAKHLHIWESDSTDSFFSVFDMDSIAEEGEDVVQLTIVTTGLCGDPSFGF